MTEQIETIWNSDKFAADMRLPEGKALYEATRTAQH
jgi:hypothetical protein